MKRSLGDGFELDDDRERIDVDAVHAFLKTSYWASHRSRDTVARLIKEATRVVGLYALDGRQVGFARVVSDNEDMAWLGDVYVLEDYRGRGFGVELVREAVDNGPQRDLGWLLGTQDAHGLYRKFGFGAQPETEMARPSRPAG
jgi:GNAT superfamily N-acetyltransferase